MKLLFLCGGSNRHLLFHKISKHLTGFQCVFLSTTKEGTSYFQNTKTQWYSIRQHDTFTVPVPKCIIQWWEKNYGFNFAYAWRLSRPRKNNNNKKWDDILQKCFYTTTKARELFDKLKPDVLVTAGIASYDHYLIVRMAQYYNIKTYDVCDGKLNNRFAIREPLKDEWHNFKKKTRG